MATNQFTIANKAVLNADLQTATQRQMFFSRFTGKAVPMTNSDRWILSGSPINTFDFKYTGRNNMEIPVIDDMGGYGKNGKQTLAGAEEEVAYFWQSLFIQLKRSGLRLPDIVDQEKVDMFSKYKDYEKLLSNWWAYYENHDVARAYFEGFGKHITDTEADGGLEKTKRLNENFWCYDVTNKDFTTNSPTFDYTYGTYLAAIIAAFEAMESAAADYFSSNTLEAITAQIPYSNIEGWETADGTIYPLVIHPLQAKTLRTDANWLTAQRSGGVRGKDNPIFRGSIGQWGDIVVYVNGLAARFPYYNGTTLNFFDYNSGATTSTDAKKRYKQVQAPAVDQKIACAILMGKNSMNKGIFSNLEYKRLNSLDYDMVDGIGAQQFYGYASNDAYNEYLGDTTGPTDKLESQSAIICTYQV